MSLADTALNIAFTEGKKQTSGSLSYNGESVTVVVGYLTDKSFSMEDAGFQTQYGDVTVIAKSSEIADWPLARDLKLTLTGSAIRGVMSVRDPIRYLGSGGIYTWLNLDRVY